MNRWLKAGLADALLNQPAYWRHARQRRLMPVLCYHRVCDEPDPLGLAVSEAEFAWQMQTLATSRQLRAVSASDYAAIWSGRQDADDRVPVLVSFDDGFRDNLTVAAPILRRHDIPAILFVTTDILQGQPPWYDRVAQYVSAGLDPALHELLSTLETPEALMPAPNDAAAWVDLMLTLNGDTFIAAIEALRRLPGPPPPAGRYLGLADLQAWLGLGLEVGSHSCSHARLSALDRDAAWRELSLSKHQLETWLGRSVDQFAYPFGRWSDFKPEHSRAAAAAGYTMAYTTVQGGNQAGDDAFLVRRKCASGGLFTTRGGKYSEPLFLADVLGIGADLKQLLGRAPRQAPAART